MITAKQLSKTYGSKSVLRAIDLQVKQGEILGIIGPNGCGKSTLMKLLSGAEKPDSGIVEIDGRRINAYKPKELARKLAVLQQEPLPPAGFTVREIVEMGRYPYQNWLGEEKTTRMQKFGVVESIIQRLQLKHLEHEIVDNLSGGERQRVALGKVMAQEPTILMLDEPTTYLDIGYQLQLMDIVRTWQQECQLTVVVILHDLNTAAMYCNQLLLLNEGTVEKLDIPASVIQAELIAHIYGTRPIVINHPNRTEAPQIILDPSQ